MPISLVPPDTSHGIRLGGVRQAFMWQQAPPARLTKQRGPWKLGKVAQLKEITARRGLHTKADRGSEAKKAVAFFVIPGSGKDALKVKKMMGGDDCIMAHNAPREHAERENHGFMLNYL
mmetsp:Transcript_2379/g.6753  ORF Transcript_2379/g.6753 Transcript_2379/m.6753 type:complete len:119 (-) Transcript_2379:211-567(-)